jgi:MFS family permease
MPRVGYLGVGFGMNLLLGTAYSWSIFASALIQEFGSAGANSFTSLLPFAVAMAMFSVGMVLAGRLVDRYGPRRIALLGAVVFSTGYLLSSLMDRTPWPMITLTLVYGGIVGLGTGFGYNPTITTAVRWFPVRKGMASGVVVMGVGLSPVITAPLASYFIGLYGVPETFFLLGVLFFATLVPMALLLRYPPDDWQPPAEVATKARSTWRPLAEVGTRDMLRSPIFWTAWALYVLGTTEGFMIIGNATKIAVEIGLASPSLATAGVMLLAVFNSGGRPVFGRLADLWTPKRALPLMYAILLGAMALLAVSNSLVPVFVGIALTGIVFGGFLAVMPALSNLFFGVRNSGANYGALFTAFGTGNIVALFAGGWIRQAYGSYVPTFYVGMLLSAIGLALCLGVRPRRTATSPT